ncbi:ABC transporter permease [Clostridium sp. AM58-1XD]|uniref:ABC transporter permease n=1 Tax=Clostridium sp. AM58-1XD TaxID=2292307 RepID=UPI000E5336F5|nr:ABC transporter permease [Clostridium sp. AM58-1XD]RGY96178.1 ABC transporter permease [Clostridium sp. AM58-1XD]
MKQQEKSAKSTAMKHAFINSFFALVFSLLLGMVLIAASGYSPWESYKAIFGVSLGTVKGFALSLSQATPIMFTGLSFALAYRVRMINTGAEGQLYAGAMAAALVGAYITNLPAPIHVPLALLAAFAAGGLVALLVAMAKVKFGANEIIMTLMLNEIIQLFTSYLANGPLKPAGSGVGQTERIADSAKLAKLIPQTQLTVAIFVVILVAILLQFMLDRTVFGYEVQVTGLNLKAAQVAGISVPRTYLITFALSGAVAGLGGAAMVLGVNYRFIEGFSSGYGFAGISVAALAAYSPVGVILSAFLIGILKAGTITLNRTTSIPVEFVDVIQVLVIIFVAAPALIQAILKIFKKFSNKKQEKKEAYGGDS